MKYKVLNVIKKYGMLSYGDNVLVALSGGSDSMTLLSLLSELKDELNLTIEAAHVNHCLRGNDSDSDEAFVKKTCDDLNIKLHLLRADVKGKAENEGISLEEAGRKIRYDFFNECCKNGKIATAHNLNDRIETMLFNISRGATLKGLCSIPPVRGNIIRPLIESSKAEILDYCDSNSLKYVTDKSNSDVKYSRNRIRHNILPELRELNPSFETAFLRCIDSVNADEEFLSGLALDIIAKAKCIEGYKIDVLCTAALPVLRRASANIISDNINTDINMKSVDELVSALNRYYSDGTGMVIQLPGNVFARTRNGLLEFPNNQYSDSVTETELDDIMTSFGDYFISKDVFKKTDGINYSQKVCKELSIFYGDYDKINGKLFVRTRSSEDRIHLKSRGVTKSLRKLQNEIGMLPELRDIIPVIADDNGLICAFGCGIDERISIDDNTETIIKIEINRGGF